MCIRDSRFSWDGLSLTGAAEHVDELMTDELLDVGAGGLEILARVELVGVLIHELTDGCLLYTSRCV